MSTILVDNLTGKTSAGSITVTSEGGAATQSLQQGLAKAWNSTNSAGTTINNSFNISSLSDNGTGNQGHNVTNTFSVQYHTPEFSIEANINQLWVASVATSGWSTNVYTGSAYSDQAVKTSTHGDLA